MKLLGALRISKKITLLLLLFILPLSVLTYVVHSKVASEALTALNAERGNAYLTRLALLEEALHRLELSYTDAGSNNEGTSVSSTLLNELDLEVSALLAIHQEAHIILDAAGRRSELGAGFSVTAQDVAKLWNSAKSEVLRRSSQELATKLEEMDGGIHSLRRFVLTASGLELEAQPETYQLMTLAFIVAPHVQELLATLALQGSALTTEAGAVSTLLRLDGELQAQRELLSEVENRLRSMASRFSDARSTSSLFDSLAATIGSVQSVSSELDTFVASKSGNWQMHIEPAAVAAAALARNSEDVLDQELHRRLESYETLTRTLWVATVLAICLIASLSFAIIRSIVRPLRELTEVATAAASDGELRRRVTIYGRDELATLSISFNQMIESLNQMIEQIRSSGQVVAHSATEIAAVSKQQQATSSEIAATTIQIETTSKEIAATSKQLANTMSEVGEVADKTAVLAEDGQAGISKMDLTMRGIMDACGSITTKLAVLSDKAGKINSVVGTITKVADQTNLLSLNAAIEAEKAGEFGQGFAVVAREIRRLADQTAVATIDIESMVKEMQTSVAAGVMGMERFADEVRRGVDEVDGIGKQLAQIISQVQTLSPAFESVNDGMQAQASGAQQITEGLSQLSEAAQQTAASIRQSSQAIDHLQTASNGLAKSVAQFRLEGHNVVSA